MKQHIRIHKAEPNMDALDYSHLLDAPAGKHGFVQARRGHLFFVSWASMLPPAPTRRIMRRLTKWPPALPAWG